VRLKDGSMVWLDAETRAVLPLDPVTACLDAGEVEGEVFITPEALLSLPPRIDGSLVERRLSTSPEHDCSRLPNSEFPALGETVRSDDLQGTVIALDPVERRVTISTGPNDTRVIPVDELSSG